MAIFVYDRKLNNHKTMKKILTLIATALFAVSVFAAEEKDSNKTDDSGAVNVTTNEEGKILHPFKDYSHWSLTVNGGLSQFDGDAKQRYNQLLSSSHIMWTVGIDVEYSFNPAWGLILGFQYMPYQGYTSTTDYGKNYFRGNMYTIQLMGSMNVLNLFGQYRKSWRWAWYINGGLGFTFYDSKTQRDGDQGDSPMKPQDVKSGRAMSFPIGTQVEYNITKCFALGINAYYRFSNKDNYEGEHYTKGTMNDGEFYATISARVKFLEKKREGGHMRNITMYEFNNMQSGKGVNYQDQIDSLKRRVKAIEDTLEHHVFVRLDSLEHYHATTPDDDEDGVPNFRDREPNTPKGSFVNYWGESIKMPENNNCMEEIEKLRKEIGANPSGATVGSDSNIDYDMSVYFDFDKYNLTSKAKKNVELAAKKMQENPNYKVELRGYCDFPGRADYNMKLSNNRVETVKNELVNKYGIDSSRISMTGKGKMDNPPKKEDKNRRCDFYFYE